VEATFSASFGDQVFDYLVDSTDSVSSQRTRGSALLTREGLSVQADRVPEQVLIT
jgi:hypothetical protein